jgi:hypothetical protein
MRGKRDGTEPRHEHGVSAALTERGLRKSGMLDADDQIIEWKLGRILRWTLGGKDQPVPDPRVLRQIRGLSGCCYSQRKLFFATKVRLYGDLAVVWHVDSADQVLRVVIATEKQPAVVWWQSVEDENPEAAAELAGRIKAQRDTRLAGLPPEQREYWEIRIARLAGSQLLAGLLAEPGPPAR